MGSISIVNSVSAFNGQHQFNKNNINGALNRLASDATGLQIADRMLQKMTSVITHMVTSASGTAGEPIDADMNRLQDSISVTRPRDMFTAEPAIRDANTAEEIANMTKFQILEQTGVAALAHCNVNSRTALSLL